MSAQPTHGRPTDNGGTRHPAPGQGPTRTVSTASPGRWYLHVVAGSATGMVATIGSEFRIGAHENAAGRLGNDSLLSPHHAVLTSTDDGKLAIVDLASESGTYLNGRRVMKPEAVRVGDTIHVGETVLHITLGAPDESAGPAPIGSMRGRSTRVTHTPPSTVAALPNCQRRDGGCAYGGPTAPASPSAAPSLAGAQSLLKAGELDASLGMFRALIASGKDLPIKDLAIAYQGAGYIAFRRKDYPEANRLLGASLKAHPENPNVLYLGGQVAAALGKGARAVTLYEEALRIDPHHAQAKSALMLQQGTLGVYECLLRDKSELSRKAVDLIDRLQISRHPRVTGFLGRRSANPPSKRVRAFVAWFALAWALILVSHIEWVRTHDGPVRPVSIPSAAMVSLTLVAIIACAYLLIPVTTRYTLARGRLTIESGVLTRNIRTTELWRVAKVELHQSIPNRITHDGTLVFTVNTTSLGSSAKDDAPEILVTGLQPIAELRETREHLMNLIFTLRSNPMIKGIVQ
jgi:hypothetical protein